MPSIGEGRVAAGADTRQWLLTPHPGEAARLLATDTVTIQGDRFRALAELLAKYRGAAVLKGVGSLVAGADDDVIGLCAGGNPGMASGGMGDVLSGILGGLLAQGLSLSQAARLGVCLHGDAADRAAMESGERGLAATDLMPWLRRGVNPE